MGRRGRFLGLGLFMSDYVIRGVPKSLVEPMPATGRPVAELVREAKEK
ncbi:hypothetical protein LCGC14_1539600 [marine sediment metagenome]|uniref:Uncharacterized protein n=1 Tax=marine sediment metagenome TaxID=412755 RepID=A0A0F9ITL6_9ZZZZ